MNTQHNDPNDAVIKELIYVIDELKGSVDSLKRKLKGKGISLILQNQLNNFEDRYNDFQKYCASKSGFTQIHESAGHIKIFADAIALNVRKETNEDMLHEATHLIQPLSKRISALLDGVKTPYEPRKSEVSRVINPSVQLGDTAKDWEIDNTRKQIAVLVEKINETKGVVGDLSSQVQDKLGQVQKIHIDAGIEIQRKKEEIDTLLGAASANVIAGSHAENAVKEKKIADILRVGALCCMGLIVINVASSLGNIGYGGEFKFEMAVIRLIIAVSLSVPAAYLARESTKHRMQQNSYLQTSLDLKTITPFIATLPLEIQHKLKKDVASRLFASKEQDNLSKDSYPINAHELLIALINKLELPSKKN